MDEMVDRVVLESLKRSRSLSSSTSDLSTFRDATTLPFHSHMLIYAQLVDSAQFLYGIKLLSNILDAQPKLFLLFLVSTGISSNDQVPISFISS